MSNHASIPTEVERRSEVRPTKALRQILCTLEQQVNWTAQKRQQVEESIRSLVDQFEEPPTSQTSPAIQTLFQPLSASEFFDASPILDELGEAILLLDSSGHIAYANQCVSSVIGTYFVGHDFFTAQHWSRLLAAVDNKHEFLTWVNRIRHPVAGYPALGTVSKMLLRLNSGRTWEVSCRQKAFHNQDTGWLINAKDISLLMAGREAAKYNSYYDPLTGLPNRAQFLETLNLFVKDFDEDGLTVAILCFNLDGFKFVNDSLGHLAGDQLLQRVAQRVAAQLNSDQVLYRLGGDEFAILASHMTDLHDLPRLAGKIEKSFLLPFVVDAKDTFVGSSIGIAVLTEGCQSAADLLQHADLAMYQVKDLGGHGHSYYNEDIRADIKKRYQLRNDLRTAIKQNEFQVYYQPKYDLKTRTLCGAEALLRWYRDGRVFCHPNQFIPEAEKCGLIVPISQLVFAQVAKDIVRWQDQGFMPILTSVNVSACHFQIGDLQEDLLSHVIENGVAPNLIELEITESSFLHDMNRAIEKIRTLQRMGFSISIDDFGTGYSSLGYLKQLPADTIKIDRTFVAEIETSEFDATLVESVIRIAHTQGLKVVAEGAETDASVEILTRFGCDQLQGYWYGKPVPVEVFVKDFLRPASEHAKAK